MLIKIYSAYYHLSENLTPQRILIFKRSELTLTSPGSQLPSFSSSTMVEMLKRSTFSRISLMVRPCHPGMCASGLLFIADLLSPLQICKPKKLVHFIQLLDECKHKIVVVKVWVFLIRSSSPFLAIWLGRDVRGECSTQTRSQTFRDIYFHIISPYYLPAMKLQVTRAGTIQACFSVTEMQKLHLES